MAYPLVLNNLSRARCVVVGGGAVAERKVAGLLAGGARPVVISPTITPRLAAWRDAGAITYHERVYRAGDLEGSLLVFAATGDPAVNTAIAADAAQAGVLANIADDPAAGSFHTVAAVRRGELLLTASTNGATPALAGFVRRELERHYGPEYATLAELLRAIRQAAHDTLSTRQRERFWQELKLGRLLEQIRSGEQANAEAELIAQLARAAEN